MIPLEKVKSIIDKHSKLEVDLSSTNIDKKKFADMSKEYLVNNHSESLKVETK